MKIGGNLCNFIKNSAEKITSSNAKNTLKEIKNQLSSIENSNQIYTTVEKNTISILKNIELKKPFSHDIKHNTLLDQKCIESIMKINNKCQDKDMLVIKQYSTLLNKLEKEHIKKTSQESEKNKQSEIREKETLLINNETLFNRVKESGDILKIAINMHSDFFKEITKEIKNNDDKNILKTIDEYNKRTSELLNKINSHEVENKKLMNPTEIRKYIEELKTYDSNINNLIENMKNITLEYGKELDILNNNHFKLSDNDILNIMSFHIDKLKEMNLQIN